MSPRHMQGMNARTWEGTLRIFFDMPASVILMVGGWKVGKTDFALFIAEQLFRLGIIDKIAGNIEVENEPNGTNYRFIQDIETLKTWLFSDSIPKLYIYDEALTGTPARRAMSRINKGLAFDVIPQLSKGKGKILAIAQTENYLDSIFFNLTFLKGMIIKESRHKAIFRTTVMPEMGAMPIKNIPRTSFRFDPYRVAVLRGESVEIQMKAKDLDRRMLLEWAKHGNYSKIAEKYKKYPQEIKRIIRQEVKELLQDEARRMAVA